MPPPGVSRCRGSAARYRIRCACRRAALLSSRAFRVSGVGEHPTVLRALESIHPGPGDCALVLTADVAAAEADGHRRVPFLLGPEPVDEEGVGDAVVEPVAHL